MAPTSGITAAVLDFRTDKTVDSKVVETINTSLNRNLTDPYLFTNGSSAVKDLAITVSDPYLNNEALIDWRTFRELFYSTDGEKFSLNTKLASQNRTEFGALFRKKCCEKGTKTVPFHLSSEIISCWQREEAAPRDECWDPCNRLIVEKQLESVDTLQDVLLCDQPCGALSWSELLRKILKENEDSIWIDEKGLAKRDRRNIDGLDINASRDRFFSNFPNRYCYPMDICPCRKEDGTTSPYIPQGSPYMLSGPVTGGTVKCGPCNYPAIQKIVVGVLFNQDVEKGSEKCKPVLVNFNYYVYFGDICGRIGPTGYLDIDKTIFSCIEDVRMWEERPRDPCLPISTATAAPVGKFVFMQVDSGASYTMPSQSNMVTGEGLGQLQDVVGRSADVAAIDGGEESGDVELEAGASYKLYIVEGETSRQLLAGELVGADQLLIGEKISAAPAV